MQVIRSRSYDGTLTSRHHVMNDKIQVSNKQRGGERCDITRHDATGRDVAVARTPRTDTTSSNQHLQIREALPGRFRGGRKIKKFVEESGLIPVAFMVMPGCVYSTIQFIFFSLSPYFFLSEIIYPSNFVSHCIVYGIRCLRIRYDFV